jgi:rubrerythrin
MSYEPRFLAHALALEEEAMNRYRELAEAMEMHNNTDVAAFFAEMSEESALHRAEVEELVGEQELPAIPAWGFDWPVDAPESASYEAVHYLMDLGTAIELALANERSAEAFYRQAAAESGDHSTAELALRFAEEERDHARRLAEKLANLSPPSAFHRVDDDPVHSPE